MKWICRSGKFGEQKGKEREGYGEAIVTMVYLKGGILTSRLRAVCVR